LVTRGDRAAATALLDLGFVRRQNGARRVARMLREFLDRNPRLKEDPSQAWLLFVGQLVNEKRNGVRVRSYSTVLQYVSIAEKHGIRPQTIGLVEERLALAAIKGGLAARKREEKKEVKFRQLPSYVYCWPIERANGQPVYRAGLFLLLATGCRAEHLSRMREVRVTNDAIYILWGDRKIREARSTELEYSYRWSTRPPTTLEPWLEAWPRVHGLLTIGKTPAYVAARRLNRFTDYRLNGHTAGLSTGYYRRRMSTLLLHEVATGRMNAMRFSDLMDHTLGTASTRYCLGGKATDLKLPLNFVRLAQ